MFATISNLQLFGHGRDWKNFTRGDWRARTEQRGQTTPRVRRRPPHPALGMGTKMDARVPASPPSGRGRPDPGGDARGDERVGEIRRCGDGARRAVDAHERQRAEEPAARARRRVGDGGASRIEESRAWRPRERGRRRPRMGVGSGASAATESPTEEAPWTRRGPPRRWRRRRRRRWSAAPGVTTARTREDDARTR